MGYRIIYKEEQNPKKDDSSRRLRMLIACGLLLFSLTVKYCWPKGNEKLCDIFLPDRIGQSQKALQTMMTDLHEGDSFSDAVTAFCLEIIGNEGHP